MSSSGDSFVNVGLDPPATTLRKSRYKLSRSSFTPVAGFYCPDGTATSDPFRNDTTLRPYPCSPGSYCLGGVGYLEVRSGDYLFAQTCPAGFFCETARYDGFLMRGNPHDVPDVVVACRSDVHACRTLLKIVARISIAVSDTRCARCFTSATRLRDVSRRHPCLQIISYVLRRRGRCCLLLALTPMTTLTHS